MNLSRRTLAKFSVAGALASLTAACAGRTQDQLTADVNLIASGLSGVVAALRGLPASAQVPEKILTQAQAAIDDIRANAASIGSSLAPNASAVQAIANAVSTLSALLSPFFPIAPTVAAVVQAALSLVPVILAAIGKAPAAAVQGGMRPAEARVVLRAGVVR